MCNVPLSHPQAQRVLVKNDARLEQKLQDAPPVRGRQRDQTAADMGRLQTMKAAEEEQERL